MKFSVIPISAYILYEYANISNFICILNIKYDEIKELEQFPEIQKLVK